MNNKGYMAHATYYPIRGKEDEFIALWREGAHKFTKECGGSNISIYFDQDRGEMISTAYWPSEKAFETYNNSETLRAWAERASRICAKPSVRHLLLVIEEAA